MAVSIRISLCPQDHGCPAIWVCPHGALTQAGLAAPKVDARRCNNCGECTRACTAGALRFI